MREGSISVWSARHSTPDRRWRSAGEKDPNVFCGWEPVPEPQRKTAGVRGFNGPALYLSGEEYQYPAVYGPVSGRAGVFLEPEFELATSDMVVQFAMRNLGIGCVMDEFAREKIEAGELFELTFGERMPDREICIVTDRKNPAFSGRGTVSGGVGSIGI